MQTRIRKRNPTGNANGKQSSASEEVQKCGSEDEVSGGVADPLPSREEGGTPVLQLQLQARSGAILAALQQAKQELAAEMEANLKQLKSVLQETQRISREMEAVLKEAKDEPGLREKAQGAGGNEQTGWSAGGVASGDRQPTSQTQGGQGGDAWHPPFMKGQNQTTQVQPWQPPSQAGSDAQSP